LNALLRLLVLVAIALLVAGCAEQTRSSVLKVYLFGPDGSCFASEDAQKACDRLKAYDRVELRVTPERNEVAYVRTAVGLDDGNVVFRNLSGCTVVSRDEFGCPGLVYSDGRFIDARAFRGLVVSRSRLAYLASARWGASFARDTLQTLASTGGLIGGLVVFAVVAVVVALAVAA
jgi:hypothetical protein